MRKLKININAGGVFSKLMFGIQYLESCNIDNVDRFYFNNCDTRATADNFDGNPFNFVINQSFDNSFESLNAIHLVNYSTYNPIEKSSKINNYKKIVAKISLTDRLINLVKHYEKQFGFDQNLIGIHIRLTDMNTIHGKDYGIAQYEDFSNSLKNVLDKKTRIFVASDNDESISKLIEEFGERVFYVPNLKRALREDEDPFSLREKELGNESIWIEAFLEMLLLSKCNTIICRSSNLSNASILFSNSIQKVIRI
jgi:hypothetical protein